MSELWGDDPEQMRQKIREQVAQAEQRAEAAQRFSSMIDNARATGTDRRREVSVEVDAAGRLISLKLTEAVLQYNPAGVEAAIMEAYGQASRTMAEKVSQQTVETFGQGTATTKELLTTFKANLESLGR
ncbi:YbaB/EbfC family nucleoid-associated protein [Schaalia vaccimaxillae]|uniref:YbaB/EbfC family nucleoid-associated protein n=1 Tax=Schaalia vaccimaxillae TaxID=183916 RepID=UPI0003B70F48|nr:YbaB/EbfC family nucleoid-associated protein [Schaalia vaccimaxillae]